MVDITNYPGAVDAINRILSGEGTVEIRMEGDNVAVANHLRIFDDVYEVGQAKGKRKK
jgi:hypothetical protein